VHARHDFQFATFTRKGQNMRVFIRSLAAAGVAGLLLAAPTAHAQVVFSDLGKNLEYQQTGATTVGAFNGGTNAFVFARSFFTHPSDFDGGTLTFSGPGSPQPYNVSGLLDCCGHFGMGYQTGYLTQANMDALFPNGVTYSLTSTNSNTSASQQVDIDFTQDLYAALIPTFTAATYNSLQNANPLAGMSIDFNSFLASAGSTFAQGFFSIYDFTSGTFVASFSGFANTTTSLFLAANTLTAGHSYEAELIFDTGVDNRDGTVYRSDNRTLITFAVPAVTPTPEPATAVLLLTGVCLIGVARRSRRAGRPAV
jgi:PEP-CTERM motif